MSGVMPGQPFPQSMWPPDSLGITDDDNTYQPMPALSSYTIAYWNDHARPSSPSMPPSSKSRLAAHLSRSHTPCDTTADSSGSGIENVDSQSHHLSSPLVLHPTSRNTSHSLHVSDDDPSNAEFASDVEKCTPATTPGFSLSHKHDLSVLLIGQAAKPTKRSRLSRHFRRSQGSIGCPKRALDIFEEAKNASHSLDKSFDNDEKISHSKDGLAKLGTSGFEAPSLDIRESFNQSTHARKSASPQPKLFAETELTVSSLTLRAKSISRSPASVSRSQPSLKYMPLRSQTPFESAGPRAPFSSQTTDDAPQIPHNYIGSQSHKSIMAGAPSPSTDSFSRPQIQASTPHLRNPLANATSSGRYQASPLSSVAAKAIRPLEPENPSRIQTQIPPSVSFPLHSENDPPSNLPDALPSWKNQENRPLGQENIPRNTMTHSRPGLERIPLQVVSTISKGNRSHDAFLKPKVPKPIKISSTTLDKPPKAPAPVVPAIAPAIVPATMPVHNTPTQSPAQSIPPLSLDTKHRITINGKHYEKLELLGRGGSAKVYKVKACDTNRLHAVKKVTFDQFEESCAAGFKGEIDLLLKLTHAERVVKLVDHAITETGIFLVMECGDIDLAHVLQQKLGHGSILDPEFVRYHAIEMFKCVEQVHDAGIVHSDLKPANFLFVRGMLKLIDFGIANAVPEHTANVYRDSQIGTPNYMAPEALIEVSLLLHGHNHTMPKTIESQPSTTWKVGKPLDVWSCGCIIYQMIYGRPPYGGYTGNLRIQAIMNPQVRISYPREGLGGKLVPESAIELMQQCLTRLPAERATVRQCMDCDFLNPKIVSTELVRDLVHLAVNFGFNNHANGGPPLTSSVYDAMIDTVMTKIRELNYA